MSPQSIVSETDHSAMRTRFDPRSVMPLSQMRCKSERLCGALVIFVTLSLCHVAYSQNDGDGTVLNLSRQSSLTDAEAAEIKAKPWTQLYLNKVESMSDEALADLASHDGKIVLTGLKSITPRAAQALATHKGALLLGLESPSDEIIATLSKLDGPLFLDAIKRLSDATAESLGAQHVGELGLDGVVELNDRQSQLLAKHRGMLRLRGVRGLTLKMASALASSTFGVTLADSPELTPEIRAALSRTHGNNNLAYVTLPPYFGVNPQWRRAAADDAVPQAIAEARGGILPGGGRTGLGGVELGTPFRELRNSKEAQPQIFGEDYSAFAAVVPGEQKKEPDNPPIIRVDSLTGRVVCVTKFFADTAIDEVLDSVIERYGKTDQKIDEEMYENAGQASAKTVIRYTYKDAIARVAATRVVDKRSGRVFKSVAISVFDRDWVEDCLMSYGYAVDAGCDWAAKAIAAFDGQAFCVADIPPLPGTERKAATEGTHAFFVDTDRQAWLATAGNFRQGEFLERAKMLMPSPITAAVGTVPDPEKPGARIAFVAFRPLKSTSTGMSRLMNIDNYNGENDITVTPAHDLLRDVANRLVQQHFEPATDKISVIQRQQAEEATLGDFLNHDGGVRAINHMFRESAGSRYEWQTTTGWTVRVGFDGSVYLFKRPRKSID